MTQVTSKRIKEERAAVRQELETTRAAETMAREERDAAREKVSTLQNALKETEREHALSRQRAESRLESLRLAAEQEEVESGAEVTILLVSCGYWASRLLESLIVAYVLMTGTCETSNLYWEQTF